MAFQEVDVRTLDMNPFSTIGDRWLLVSAGDESGCNTMTASWGAMGVLWGEPAVTIYLRPQRYTKEFVDAADLFTVSVLAEDYRSALGYCGRVSGRDVDDKFARAGLTPLFVDGTAGVAEADLVLVCRKIYADHMPPANFIDGQADRKWYPDHDYHTMYIGKVEKALVKA